MTSSGKIIKINNELNYGFIQIPKVGEVFFSSETKFAGTKFELLKVNDTVQISVSETDRGLFADSLTLNTPKSRERSPEAAI